MTFRGATRFVLGYALVWVLGGCGELVGRGFALHLSVESVTPLEGPTSGGTVITLEGTDFCGELIVTADGVSATQVQVESPSLATAMMPDHLLGDAVVRVECGGEKVAYEKSFHYSATTVQLILADSDPGYAAYRDLDGDGKEDGIAVLETDAGTLLEIHESTARGFDPLPLAAIPVPAFAEQIDPFTGEPPVVVADFDKGGKPDLMVFGRLDAGDSFLHLRLFGGETGFSEIGRCDLAGSESFVSGMVNVLDLDGDGMLDLVTCDGRRILVFHGNGPCSFEIGQDLSFDDEGYLDVVPARHLSWRMLNGYGRAIDFDGDGYSDGIFATGAGWTFVLGDPDRQYAVTYSREIYLGKHPIFFNLDSLPDEAEIGGATAVTQARTITIRPAIGLEEFDTEVSYEVPCTDLLCPELVDSRADARLMPRRFDVDEDGAPEFLLVNWTDTNGREMEITSIAWIELGPDGFVEVLYWASNHGTSLDSSSVPFLRTVSDHSHEGARVITRAGVEYIGKGNLMDQLARRALTSFGRVAYNPSVAPCLGDFTGDGVTDVIGAGTVEEMLLLFQGSGDGWFESVQIETPPGYINASCTAANFTNDGYSDFHSSLSVYLNHGEGRFVEATPSVDGSDAAWLSSSDLDGDGLDDLVAGLLTDIENGASRDREILWLRALGDGSFEPTVPADLELLVGAPEGARLVAGDVVDDLNGDGLLDVAECLADSGTLHIAEGKQYGEPFERRFFLDTTAAFRAEEWGACRWVRSLGEKGDRLLVTSNGNVITRADGTYRVSGRLEIPGDLQIEGTQVALCDLRGRGRGDLVFVVDGSFGYAAEIIGRPLEYDAIYWSSLAQSGILSPSLVGCTDTNGDRLDDLVVRDGFNGRLFGLLNASH